MARKHDRRADQIVATSGGSNSTPGVVRNEEEERRQQVANAYRQLGGVGNTDHMTLPTLEKNFTAAYERNQAENSNPLSGVDVFTSPYQSLKNFYNNYKSRQEASSLYNEIKNNQTERTLERLGQTDEARQGQNPFLEQATSMLVGTLAGSTNFAQPKQNLTAEMQNAGITEDELRRYNQRINQAQRQETMQNLAKDHPILSSIGAYPDSLVESVDNTLKQGLNYLQGKPLEEAPTNADIIRQTVGQMIDLNSPEFLEKIGISDEKLSNAGRVGYSFLNSLGDMALAGLVGGGAPKAAAGLMGAEKANETINNAISRGLDPNEIMAEGLGSYATTALTERIPFGNIANGGKLWVSALSEGAQEMAEDLADSALDRAVTYLGGNYDDSEWRMAVKRYMDAGYSESDAKILAKREYEKQVILDGILGAISGGLVHAGNDAVGRIFNMNPTPPNDSTPTGMNQEETVEDTKVYRMPEDRDRVASNPLPTISETTDNRSEGQDIPSLNSNAQPKTVDLNEVKAIAEETENSQPEASVIPSLNQDYYKQWAEDGLLGPGVTPENVSRQDVINANMYEENNAREDLAKAFNDLGYDYYGGEVNDNYDSKNTLLELDQNWDIAHDFLARGDFSAESFAQAVDEAIKSGNPDTRVADIVRRAYQIEGKTPNENKIGGAGNTQYLSPTIGKYFERAVKRGSNTQSEVSGAEYIQRGRDARNLINRAEQYKDKLATFNNKSFDKRIDNAIQAVREGKENAVENLNSLLAEIDEKMNGEVVGVSERTVNQDFYDQMKNVTDGRVIHISPETLKAMDMNVTQLNNLISTGSGRLRFVTGGGTPIDSVYQEMYDLAGGMLPEPRSMGESDMVDAIVKYITDQKSGKNNVVNEQTWNNMPLSETRTPAVVEAQTLSDNIIDDFVNGKYKTREEAEKAWSDYINKLSELGRKYPEARSAIGDVAEQTSIDYRRSRLDSDIRNAKNANDINKALLKMNLGFFGGAMDEDVDTDYVNKAQTGNFKESDVYNNTGKNSGIMTDRQIEQHEKDNNMLYESIDEKSSMDQAYKSLKERGRTPERERLLNAKDWTNSDVDEAFILWQIAVDEATAIDNRGGDSTKAWEEASKFFEKIKDMGSGAGQELQAFAKWSRNNTAEGLLSHAATTIKRAREGQRAAQNNWDSQVAKLTKDAHEMDADFMKEFLTEARKLETRHTVAPGETLSDIAKQYGTTVQELIKLNGKNIKEGQNILVGRLDMNSTEARHIMANLGKMINSQMPPSLAEKLTTFLMDNMLGNIRTLITRNAGGNVGFNLMEEFLRRPLSALIDSKLSEKRGTNRTVYGLTKEGWDAWKEGFKEGFKQEIYDFQNDIQSARSGENTLDTATANNREVFNNKLLKKYNKLVKAGLSIGDRPFYEATYKQSLVEYNRLYNEGKIKGLDGKPLPKAEFDKLAEMHAKLNALAAVYQDDSTMAQAFVGMKQAIGKMSEGLVGSDILSQFSMPFVKTPANIIERSIEYSPLGLAKNLVQTLREVKSDKIDFNQERFATELSRNIIGTGLFALGLFMANAGGLTGAYSDDKDMKQAQKEAGMQEYALHTGFGDFDLSWIPVLGNNLVSAAAAFDSFNRPDVEGGQAIGNGITAGVRSQFDTSALQGLQRLVGGSGSGYNSDTDIVTNAKNTLLSGGTQFVPSLLRQAAAFSDPYQRQLSGPNQDDYYRNSVLNAIPGLRQTLEPKIGRTGEELEQNAGQGTLGKFLSNFISPATWTRGTEDAVRDEAMRLFEATGNNIAFQPSVTIGELKTDDHVPTPEEFTAYQQEAYTNMNQLAQQMINSDFYASLTDGDKEAVLDDIYKAVKNVAKANALGTDHSELSGASRAFYEGGNEALLEYVTCKNVLGELGMQNNEKNREIILETLQNEGAAGVQNMLQQSQELANAGLDTNMQFKYDHATNYIPSLTPTQFADIWNAMNTDNNTSIKIDEVLDYLNQNPGQYDQQTATQLWNAYYTGTSSKLPVLNANGYWEAK